MTNPPASGAGGEPSTRMALAKAPHDGQSYDERSSTANRDMECLLAAWFADHRECDRATLVRLGLPRYCGSSPNTLIKARKFGVS